MKEKRLVAELETERSRNREMAAEMAAVSGQFRRQVDALRAQVGPRRRLFVAF